MKRKEKSRSRSRSGIRQHKKTNKKLESNSESESDNTVELTSIKLKRKKYTLAEKKNFVDRYKKIKANFPNRGIRSIANELDVPKSSLIEWIKQIPFIDETISTTKKYRLEDGGRNPSTIDLEEDLIKWVSEQRRLEIGITTTEININLIRSPMKNNSSKFY